MTIASVLINNYNYGHFVLDAVESALAQTEGRERALPTEPPRPPVQAQEA